MYPSFAEHRIYENEMYLLGSTCLCMQSCSMQYILRVKNNLCLKESIFIQLLLFTYAFFRPEADLSLALLSHSLMGASTSGRTLSSPRNFPFLTESGSIMKRHLWNRNRLPQKILCIGNHLAELETPKPLCLCGHPCWTAEQPHQLAHVGSWSSQMKVWSFLQRRWVQRSIANYYKVSTSTHFNTL